MSKPKSTNFGQLKQSGYTPKTIHEELRDNLIGKWANDEIIFPGIYGYDDTVIPQIERAILAGHSINFLGLRGQAKTKMARQLVDLLDEWMPIVAGSEINDDPFNPLSPFAKREIEENGDETPIDWVHKSERYVEKLATPDVNIADLIGDIDPIKAANLRKNFNDDDVIHYGLIPRANRCIFVINELPDLQPRIQVSLFNVLQEGDIQIRGFQMRLPLDIQFVFTANPEDYTNRGAIITPLKDRIQSQIFTHYPDNLDVAQRITQSQVNLSDWQKQHVIVPELIQRLIEQVAVEARENEFVDEKSGVSARLPITVYEHVVASVERRVRKNKEEQGVARIGDLNAAIPAIVGKIEMVYEGEQEGAANVAYHLINMAIRNLSDDYFQGISQLTQKRSQDLRGKFDVITQWFENGQVVELLLDNSNKAFSDELDKIPGLDQIIDEYQPHLKENERLIMKEYLIHSLAAYSLLQRERKLYSYRFEDYFNSILPGDLS